MHVRYKIDLIGTSVLNLNSNMSHSFFPYYVLFFVSAILVEAQPRHNLTFMFMTSYGQHGHNSSSTIPAVDIALEDINGDQDMLPGYYLHYDEVRDSQVSTLKLANHIIIRCRVTIFIITYTYMHSVTEQLLYRSSFMVFGLNQSS